MKSPARRCRICGVTSEQAPFYAIKGRIQPLCRKCRNLTRTDNKMRPLLTRSLKQKQRRVFNSTILAELPTGAYLLEYPHSGAEGGFCLIKPTTIYLEFKNRCYEFEYDINVVSNFLANIGVAPTKKLCEIDPERPFEELTAHELSDGTKIKPTFFHK